MSVVNKNENNYYYYYYYILFLKNGSYKGKPTHIFLNGYFYIINAAFW